MLSYIILEYKVYSIISKKKGSFRLSVFQRVCFLHLHVAIMLAKEIISLSKKHCLNFFTKLTKWWNLIFMLHCVAIRVLPIWQYLRLRRCHKTFLLCDHGTLCILGSTKTTSDQVIWHKAASPPQTVQLYSPGGINMPSHEGTGTTWRIRLNLCFLGPTECTTQMANRSVQPFSHILWQKVFILYNGRLFPKNCPLPMGDLDPHLINDSLVQSKPTIQTVSRSVQPFLHRWPQTVPILYNGIIGMPLSPSKLPISHGNLDLHLTRLWLLFVYEISRELGLASNSQGRCVWSLARTSLNIMVKGQSHHRQKWGLRQTSWELLNGFATNSYVRCFLWTSLKVKVTRDKNGIFWPFQWPAYIYIW